MSLSAGNPERGTNVMKSTWMGVLCVGLLGGGVASADTWYVSTNSPTDGPGTAWSNAFHTIQGAVAVATNAGDVVRVTNGTYELDSEIVVTSDITIESVNGPAVTAVDGQGNVRCFSLGSSASAVTGFTIRGGLGKNGIGGDNGGGVHCNGNTPVISNCLLRGNSASQRGGGAYGGQLINCTLYDNKADDSHGGGCYKGKLINCTLAGNYAKGSGGGSYDSVLTNCIVWGNTARIGGNDIFDGETSYCCSPDVTPGTDGNITDDPLFVDAASHDYRLQPSSPCVNAGANLAELAAVTDLDGLPRIIGGTVDMGAYEHPLPVIAITNTMTTVSFDMTPVAIGGTNNEWVVGLLAWTNAANGAGGTLSVSGLSFRISSVPLSFGANTITVSGTNRFGGVAADSVTLTRNSAPHAGDSPIHYVSTNGAAVWPFTNWTTAARSIQHAVDAALAGDTVLVTNGVYATGSAVTPGYACQNRVVITNATTVRSVNGPAVTEIVGAEATGGGNGPDAVRGVYMSTGVLAGFTVTKGHTMRSGGVSHDWSGGGVNMRGGNGVVSNCTLSGNSAGRYGGGSYEGTMNT